MSDKNIFKDVADDFLKFIKGKKIVIHNAEFDISHINNELSIAGYDKIDKKNVIDTLDLARKKFPGSPASLDALCKRYRIDNSKRDKHTALLDCELLSKVYINLLDQKEPSLNFKNQDGLKEYNSTNVSGKYSKKIVVITDEEISLHKSFLKSSLKKNHF